MKQAKMTFALGVLILFFISLSTVDGKPSSDVNYPEVAQKLAAAISPVSTIPAALVIKDALKLNNSNVMENAAGVLFPSTQLIKAIFRGKFTH